MIIVSKELNDQLKIVEGKLKAHQKILQLMISSNAVSNNTILSTLTVASDDIIESLRKIVGENSNDKQ